MKLNFDCIRDTLLYLEEALVINFQQRTFESISLNQLIEDIMLKHTHYEANEIWYSVYSLKQAGFIEGRFENPGNKKLYICNIENITWSGHQFLDSIRPDSIWDAIKHKANQIGGISISGLSTIATTILQELTRNPDFIQSIIDRIC